jgi:hypothetical protein
MLCIKGCGFYGSQDREGYCSLCYSKIEQPPLVIKFKKRCFLCKRKVGINGFICKCNNTFCTRHRYVFEHKCTFNHKTYEKDKIREKNPELKKEKFERI